MKNLSILILLLTGFLSSAQEVLSLEECYDLAEENYPLASQISLLREKNAHELEVIQKEYLPKVDLNGKATYQSDVIEIPLNMGDNGIEPVDKDQYRTTVDVEQLIYNGGSLDARKELKKVELLTEAQQVKVSLYQIKRRINKYYFTILQLRAREALLESKVEVLTGRLKELESQVNYGAALPSSEKVLKAEILKIHQQQDSVRSTLSTALSNLSFYTGLTVDASTILKLPDKKEINEIGASRPEIELYDLKQKELEQNKNLISKDLYPKVFGFAQGGYGKPGFNMLDNSFEDFYLVGLKVNWNIFDWGRIKEQKRSLDIAQDLIEVEKETFSFNNNIELEEARNEIQSLENMLEKDREIIDLREGVLEAASSQLNNGIITSSQYLTEFNNLYEAKIDQQLHQIGLERAKADYRVLKGKMEN